MVIETLQTSAQLYTVKKEIVGWVEELNPTINPISNSGIAGKFESLLDNEKSKAKLKEILMGYAARNPTYEPVIPALTLPVIPAEAGIQNHAKPAYKSFRLGFAFLSTQVMLG